MSDRENFESLAAELGLSLRTGHTMSGESYSDSSTYYAYEAWQASRKQALEDAAYVSEQKFRRAADGNEIAEAIRNLAKPEGEQS